MGLMNKQIGIVFVLMALGATSAKVAYQLEILKSATICLIAVILSLAGSFYVAVKSGKTGKED